MPLSSLFLDYPLYMPSSAGQVEPMNDLTHQTIQEIFPLLAQFSNDQNGQQLEVEELDQLPLSPTAQFAANRLKNLFNTHHSDKSSNHNYELLYGEILQHPDQITKLVEVGLGTNNEDVVSHMGRGGSPGASLRAFRDYLPAAEIYGGDVDRRILFTEERIQTHFIDQLNPFDLMNFAAWLPDDCDLIIDDGLHSINANLNTVNYLLPKVKLGGWLVVEDIGLACEPFWQVVARILPIHRYRCRLIRSRHALVFAINRMA